MNTIDLDSKINTFLGRKFQQHPDVAVDGREQSRTAKYAQDLRDSGQLIFSR